jgi:CHASE2 domain-containing sensor protein
MEETRNTKTVFQRISRAILRPPVLAVFLLVGLWNVSVSSGLLTRSLEGDGSVRETLREIRDVNLHLQLRFYNLLTRGRPIGLRNDYVTLVYIDDDTHWDLLGGSLPTNRAFLAKLVRNLSEPATRALVIGLDIQLLAPRDFPTGTDDVSRAADNAELLKAIQNATAQGVPVILGGAFIERSGGSTRLADLFTEAQLIQPSKYDCDRVRCPAVGYVNGPEDKRLIPLTRRLRTESTTAAPMDSFALATAKAVSGPEEANSTSSGLVFQTGTVFGSFLPEKEFRDVSALNVEQMDPDALRMCEKRVVLIGAHWHDLQGYGELVDNHLSPAGEMSGLAFHANYVESLLEHQFAQEPPLWVGILIDLIVGLVIYASFELATGWRGIVVLSLAFFMPILGAYFFLVTANLYLDFFLPIELYFVHLLYEAVADYVALKRHPGPEPGHGGRTAGSPVGDEVPEP